MVQFTFDDDTQQALAEDDRLMDNPAVEEESGDSLNSAVAIPLENQDIELLKIGVSQRDLEQFQVQNRIGAFENFSRNKSRALPGKAVIDNATLLVTVNRLQEDLRIRENNRTATQVQETGIPTGLPVRSGLFTASQPLPGPQRLTERPLEAQNRDVEILNAYLTQKAEEAIRGTTFGAKFAAGALELPDFLVAMLATSGAGAFVKEGFKEFVESIAKKEIKRRSARFAVGTAGNVAAGIAQTALSPQLFLAETFERRVESSIQMTPQGAKLLGSLEEEEKPITSLMLAFTDTFVAMFSERVGGSVPRLRLPKALAPTSKKLKNFADAMEAVFIGSKTSKGGIVNNLWDRVQFQGFITEMGEERLEKLMESVFGVNRQPGESQLQFVDRLLNAIPDAEELMLDASLITLLGTAKTTSQGIDFLRKSRLKTGVELTPEPAALTPEQVQAIKGEEEVETPAVTPTSPVVKPKLRPAEDVSQKLQDIITTSEELATQTSVERTRRPVEQLERQAQELTAALEQQIVIQDQPVPAGVQAELRQAQRRLISSRQKQVQKQQDLTKELQQKQRQLTQATSEPDIKSLTKEVGQLRSRIAKAGLQAPPKDLVGDLRKAKRNLDRVRQETAQNALVERIRSVDPGKLPPAQQEQVRGILETLQTQTPRAATLGRLQGTLDFLKTDPDAVLPQEHINELERLIQTPVKDLSTDQARLITQAIDHFEKLGRLKQDLEQRQQDRDKSQTVQSMVQEMGSDASILQPKRRTDAGLIDEPTFANIVQGVFSRIGNATLDTLGVLTGGTESSVTHQKLSKNIINAWFKSRDFYYAGLDAVTNALRNVGLDPTGDTVSSWSAITSNVKRRRLSAVTLGRVLPVNDVPLEAWTDKNGKTVTLDAAQKMHIVAMMRDPDTRDIALFQKNEDGSKGVPLRIRKQVNSPDIVKANKGVFKSNSDTLTLDPDLLAEMEASLTDGQLVAIDAAVKYLNGPYKEMVRQWSLKHHGFDITKSTTWFSRHRFRQGEDVEINAGNFVQKSLETAGLVQERTGSADPIEIRDFLVEYANLMHVGSTVTQVAPQLNEAASLLNSKPVREFLSGQKKGSVLLQQFRRHYDAIASRAVPMASIEDDFGKAVGATVRNVTRGLLRFNPRVGLYQVVSTEALKVVIPPRFVKKAINSRAAFRREIDDRMFKQSGWLRFRASGAGSSIINEAIYDGQVLGGAFNANNVADESGWGTVRRMDNAAIRVGWVAAEFQAMEEMGIDNVNDPLIQQRAMEITHEAVSRTQPTFDAPTVSGLAVLGGKRPERMLLLMFRAQRSKNIDMTIRETHNFLVNPTKQQRLQTLNTLYRIYVISAFKLFGIKQTWNMARATAAALVAGRTLSEALEPDDDEDNLFTQTIREMQTFSLGNIPVLGSGIDFLVDMAVTQPVLEAITGEQALQNKFDPDFSPVFSLLERLTSKDAERLARADGIEEFLLKTERALESLLPLLGMPVTPLRELRLFAEEVEEEKGSRRRL